MGRRYSGTGEYECEECGGTTESKFDRLCPACQDIEDEHLDLGEDD